MIRHLTGTLEAIVPLLGKEQFQMDASLFKNPLSTETVLMWGTKITSRVACVKTPEIQRHCIATILPLASAAANEA